MIKRIKVSEEMIKIIISIFLFTLSFFPFINNIVKLILLFISYIVISYEIYINAFKNIIKGEIFDENFLMILASIGAIYIGEYTEAIVIIILFEIGEYLSDLIVDNSKKSITDLLDSNENYVNIKLKKGIKKVNVCDVVIDDVLVIKQGEKILLDGIIINGHSYLDTSSLTGESLPLTVKENDKVLSGMINLSSILEIRVTSLYENSTISKIKNLLENATDSKTKTEKFITRFSKIYTPIVVLSALILFLVPTILGYDANTWLYRALEFLVISCPCALVISVPLGFFCGIGRASKEGILIKSSNNLDNLSQIKTIVFDKTGTITKGIFDITKINAYNISEKELLTIITNVESLSNHPIAKAITNKYDKDTNNNQISNFEEISGMGIKCLYNKDEILIGNKELLKKNSIDINENNDIGTIIYVARNQEYIGSIVISDVIKDEAYNSIYKLKNMNIKNIFMLSGDNEDTVYDVCKKVNIDKYYANLLPIDKVNIMEEIKKESLTAFIGDGMNDAPVIKLSDVGIAMGHSGSDISIESADIVIMNDNLKSIHRAIKISRFTKKIIKFNILFAIIFKIFILLISSLGFTSIWVAVFADVGVTIISILNTLSIMNKKFD